MSEFFCRDPQLGSSRLYMLQHWVIKVEFHRQNGLGFAFNESCYGYACLNRARNSVASRLFRQGRDSQRLLGVAQLLLFAPLPLDGFGSDDQEQAEGQHAYCNRVVQEVFHTIQSRVFGPLVG